MRFSRTAVGMLLLLLSSCDSVPIGGQFRTLRAGYDLTPDERASVSRGISAHLRLRDEPSSLELKAWRTSEGMVDVCGIAELGTFFSGHLYREGSGTRFEVSKTADAVSMAPGLSKGVFKNCGQ